MNEEIVILCDIPVYEYISRFASRNHSLGDSRICTTHPKDLWVSKYSDRSFTLAERSLHTFGDWRFADSLKNPGMLFSTSAAHCELADSK